VRDALLFGFLVLTVWSFWPVMKDLLRRLRASGRVAFGAMTERDAVLAHEPVALLRFVPLGFGLFALWYFRLYLDGAPWQEGRQLFHVERALAIESFVSPTPVVVLLCGTVFWWAIWNMRRIYLGATAYDETAGIIQFLDLRGRAERRPFVRVLNDPVLRVGRDAWLWIILAVAVVLPFVVAWRTGSAVDGQAFGRFLWWGSLLVLTILSHTLVNIVHVGRTLLGLLRSLGRHGIAPTFAAIHDEPLNWRLSFHALRPGDAEPLFTRMRTLVREVDHATNREVSLRGNSDIAEPVVTERRRSGSGEAHASATDRTAGRLMEIRADDVALFHGQLATHNERSRPGHPFVERRQLLPRTVAWQLSSRMSGPLLAWLERCFWSQPKRLRDSDLTPVHDEAQRLIALQAALVIRDLLTRLTSSCTMVVGGFVLLTGSHLFYSFQGRRIWLTLDWSYLVFASTAILLLLIRLDKTTVIKHLWGLQEGRINWSSGFAYRILAYGAIPVVTLFATIFPELGSSVLTWLEPVRKALP
jgi:hypothetical protein